MANKQKGIRKNIDESQNEDKIVEDLTNKFQKKFNLLQKAPNNTKQSERVKSSAGSPDNPGDKLDADEEDGGSDTENDQHSGFHRNDEEQPEKFKESQRRKHG